LRVCVYALDDNDDVGALLRGADAIAVIVEGAAADRETVAAIAPYVTEGVAVLLACAPDRAPEDLGVAYPTIVSFQTPPPVCEPYFVRSYRRSPRPRGQDGPDSLLIVHASPTPDSPTPRRP
jgi:hypothetical protein